MPTYTPNHRWIPNNWANRSIFTQFPYGFIEGLTKVSISGKVDCLFEGPEMFQAFFSLLMRYFGQSSEFGAQTAIN